MNCAKRCLYCALGSKPCFVCCKSTAKESTTTRLCYSSILLLVTILSTASHLGGFSGLLYEKFENHIVDLCTVLNAGAKCERFTGFIGIYRLCLVLFVFHFLMAILTLNVNSSQTFRGKLHNGFWLLKVIVLICLYILTYYFSVLEQEPFPWMILGIIGGLLFIYVQHVTLIDFAYELNGIWHCKSSTNCCYTFLRQRQLWLPGAITSIFVAYLTWTALNSQPRILDADVPWQRHFGSGRRNVSVHPLIIVADQLNRLLSDQTPTAPTTGTDTSTSATSASSSFLINECVPQENSFITEHIGQELSTFSGLVLVLGGSLYASFRVTLQARRLGIQSKRQKLKQLLMPIEEQPEPQSSVSVSTDSDTTEPSAPWYVSKKELKRQEKALNLLANAVADLPNPKVFRRPSARQPRANRPAVRPRHKQIGGAMLDLGDGYATPNPIRQAATIKQASSDPDLSVTMRKLTRAAQNRVDIRDFHWGSPSSSVANPIRGQSRYVRKQNQTSNISPVLNRPIWSNKRRDSKIRPAHVTKQRMDNHLEPILNQLHAKDSRKRSKDMKIKKNRDINLTKLLPPAFPEYVGSRIPPLNGQLAFNNEGFGDKPDRKPLVHPPKRFSNSKPPVSSSLLDLDIERSPTHLPPTHPVFQRARSASQVVLSKHGMRMLESQPSLASSFAFLGPLLNKDAPRDGYIVYNEAIAVVYSYSWFHVIYAIATLYLMAQLTNWYNPRHSSVEALTGSWANMWMKLASSWIAILLYSWTITCQRLCLGRKLGDTPLTPHPRRTHHRHRQSLV